MRAGRECMQAGDWTGAIRAYGQGPMEQPLLGMHYSANLERARTKYRQERQTINQQGPDHTTVVVAAAELSHNAAGRAYTLAQLYRHLGHPVTLLGSHFPQWGRELWQPIRGAGRQQGLPVHSFVVEHQPSFVNQAWGLVLQQPADLVHLSKPRGCRRWCLACSTSWCGGRRCWRISTMRSCCLWASGSRSRSMASNGCATGFRNRATLWDRYGRGWLWTWPSGLTGHSG
jgi:hypothetical protein